MERFGWEREAIMSEYNTGLFITLLTISMMIGGLLIFRLAFTNVYAIELKPTEK